MYHYLIVYQYLQTKFDLHSFNNNIYNIVGNLYVDTNKKMEKWTSKDYGNLKNKIAKVLSSKESQYREEDIIILNVIKKGGENEKQENILS